MRTSGSLTFAGLAWKNLWRRRLRTSLTIGGIGMGVAAFVALVGFSRAFEHAWMQMYQTSGTDLDVVQRNFLNTTIDLSAEKTIRSVPQVRDVAPMIFNLMAITPEVNTLVFGWEPNSFEFDSLQLLGGRRFRSGASEVMLGQLLADSLHKQSGDPIQIQGGTYTVAGVYRGGSALEAGALIMPLAELQKLTGMEGKVSAFHVRLKTLPGESRVDALQSAETAIETALPGLRALPAAERASKNQLVRLAQATAWGTSLIALFVAALGIANTMAMSVFERTREIGILRASGWKQSRVVRLILLESATLGAAGGIAGILLGWLALSGLSVLPQSADMVARSLPLVTSIEGVCIAAFVGVAAGAVPAWRGAQLSPVEALRYE